MIDGGGGADAHRQAHLPPSILHDTFQGDKVANFETDKVATYELDQIAKNGVDKVAKFEADKVAKYEKEKADECFNDTKRLEFTREEPKLADGAKTANCFGHLTSAGQENQIETYVSEGKPAKCENETGDHPSFL